MIDSQSDEFLEGTRSIAQCCESILLAPQAPETLTEYELIKSLAGKQCFEFLGNPTGMVLLFYKHFLTMHCLYQLLPKFYLRGMLLTVSPLAISLERFLPASTPPGNQNSLQLSHFQQALSDYYSDLGHLANVTEDTVEELLGQFWKKFATQDGVSSACSILGVDDTADWPLVQLAYRKKIAIAHPDKGGSPDEFVKVKEAFELIKQRMGR